MFEKALIECTHRPAPRGRLLLLLGVAVLAHLVALVVLTAAQVWAVEPVPEPIIMISCKLGGYLGAPEPVPPPPRAAVPRDSTSPVQPTAVSAVVPPRDTGETETGSDDPTVPGGVNLGDSRRLQQHVVVATPVPTPTPEPEEPRRVYTIGGAVTAPVLLDRVDPAYPVPARAARKQGDVRVRAVIDRDGTVSSVDLEKDDVGYGAGELVRSAVLRWRYEPATSGGRPVPVWIVITVSFRLS